MTIQPPVESINDWLALKKAGYFTVEKWGTGFAVTAHRNGQSKTVLCKTPGEVNRVRQVLSDAGLCGYVGGQRP